MYLSHFGFPRQPFNKIAADFFYGGANRGATLDKILYVLTHGEGVEGIIQVVGETGSGKTTLCRLLMSRLPANLKTIYLAKPDLSREELFQSIADELKFELPESDAAAAPTIATLCERQGALIEQHADGRQLVLLLDEAHTLPMETLEALRLLYELESSRHKLLQIVLLGQTKLKTTLALPQMRQFRACVTDHFIMQPFDAEAVREYLILRMRAAGYRGPEVFTPDAIRLIVMASGGLIQQIDTLADKSLLAASAAHNRDVREQHVREAVRNAEDSGIRHRSSWRDGSSLLGHRGVGMGAVLAMAALSVLGWQVLHSESTDVSPAVAPTPVEVMASVPVPPPIYTTVVEKTAPGLSPPVSASAPGSTVPAQSALPPVPPVPPQAGTGKVASAQGGSAPAIEQHSNTKVGIGGARLAGYGLLEERMEATKKTMAATDKNYYSIQLFATENIQPDRMERFLSRAQNLVNLSDLYMHAVTHEGQAQFRVTYGIYPTREQASAAVDELPQKYKTAFHPELYTLGELR